VGGRQGFNLVKVGHGVCAVVRCLGGGREFGLLGKKEFLKTNTRQDIIFLLQVWKGGGGESIPMQIQAKGNNQGLENWWVQVARSKLGRERKGGRGKERGKGGVGGQSVPRRHGQRLLKFLGWIRVVLNLLTNC